MRHAFLSAAAGLALATAAAAPASAAIMFVFQPGAASPTVALGYEVIHTFDDATGLTGSNFQIKTPPADGDGAPPANSVPAGTPYLSVLGGGFATFNFTGVVTAFQFDWGSIDTYNTLSITTTGADPIIIPGTNFTNPANGNQVSPGTNGLFSVFGTAGETFTSVTFSSGQNSFEVDNLAVISPGAGNAVPEPTTWALMIMGFGGAGAMLRRRRLAVA